MTESDVERAWWKEAVVYQIYPRSFNDSNGDGIGDIPGIIERLDYLDDLGVDVIWLNPVYESPNADNGYDIADYRAIMDEFGTMDDWETLLAGLHDRGMRLIMDLVVNHTSDEHEWFVRSRRGDEEYEDYYIWREGRDVEGRGGPLGPDGEAPPNNWESFFGGPAWAYEEERGKWYLHLFDRKQPDLNWENPAVRDEIFEMMEWWLEKGIDGFRMDVINLISKPDGLPDVDPAGDDEVVDLVANGPRIHEYLGEMNDRVLEGRDLLTVGEMVGTPFPIEEARRYVGTEGDGLSMLFHFEHVLLDQGQHIWVSPDWELPELKAVFTKWQEGLFEDGWNSLYLSNHDHPRLVSRFGNDGDYRVESATLLATLLFTLRGTPYVYQGDELGMTNYPFESLEEFRDVATLNPLESALESGDVESFEAVREAVRTNSRDNSRTPMQWSPDADAGFTDGEPWIAVNPNYEEINAADARADEGSVWRYYRRLIDLRHDEDVLVYGKYDHLLPDHPEMWAYTRTLGEERLLVLLNFSRTATVFEAPDSVEAATGERVLGNYGDWGGGRVDGVDLRPWEARVYRLT